MTMAEICQYNSLVQDPNLQWDAEQGQKTAIAQPATKEKRNAKRQKTAISDRWGWGGNSGVGHDETRTYISYSPPNTPQPQVIRGFHYHNLALSTQPNPKKGAICQPRQLPAVYVAFPITPVVMQGSRDFCPQTQTGTGVPA